MILLILAPILGGAVALLLKLKNQNNYKLVLSFSGAFLFSVTLLHLLPFVFKAQTNAGIFILIGFFIQIVLEQLTKGVEHGHFHVHHESRFYVVSVLIGLSLHAFMDGLPLSNANAITANYKSLLYGISLHKIPEGFALASLMLAVHYKKITVGIFVFLFALVAPLGTYVSDLITGINPDLLIPMLAIAIGSFLHVSTTILFESENSQHHFGWKKMTAVALGLVLAFLS